MKPIEWIAERRENLARGGCLLFSLGSAFLLLRFFEVTWNPLVYALTAAALTLAFRSALRCAERRVWISFSVFSALLSAAVVVGRRVDEENAEFLGLSAPDLVYWLCFSACFAGLCVAVSEWLRAHPLCPLGVPQPETVPSRLMSWASWTGIVLLGFLFYYFVFFPGLMTGDSFACYVRAAGIAPISNQQPVVYQLVLAVFVAFGGLFGDPNAGVAFFTLFQALAMASIFGYSLYWLRRRGCPRPVLWLLSLWFGWSPLHGMYAVTMWKDVPFGGILLLLTLFLADVVRTGGKTLLRWQGTAHFVLLCLAAAFLRNNGLYLLVCVFLVAGVQLRAHWKRLVPLFLSILVGIGLVQGPVYAACGFAQSPFAESLAIPLQQMARVVSRDGVISDEQAEYLDQLLPLETQKDVYWAFTADRIKFHADFDDEFLEANKGGFFSTWFGMLFPNFREYVVAFLMETAGYWRLGTTNWVVAEGIVGYGDTYGIEPANLSERVFGDDLQPRLQAEMERQQEDKFLGPLCNIASMVWLVFFACALLLARGQGRALLFLVPLLALWATTMIAAPTYCELRYLYAFFTCAPAVVWLALPRRGETIPERSTKAAPGRRRPRHAEKAPRREREAENSV